MRLVTALVKPFKVEDVKEAVLKAGGAGLTLTESRGFGRQRGHTEVYRGTEYTIEFVPKVRVEVLVDEHVRRGRRRPRSSTRPAPGRSATARCGSPRSTRSSVCEPASGTGMPCEHLQIFDDFFTPSHETVRRCNWSSTEVLTDHAVAHISLLELEERSAARWSGRRGPAMAGSP